ncbi:MAG: heterocyst development glycosyltransferase HepC [Cyanobacteria bacterium P01_H01_bin.119]
MTSIVLKTAKLSVLKAPLQAATPLETADLSRCQLKWRQGKLLVEPLQGVATAALPALCNLDWFKRCLMRSRAQAIYIDPTLGNHILKLWADAGEAAHLPVYLKLPASNTLPPRPCTWAWRLKCGIDRVAAALLLLLLTPLMLSVIALMKLTMPGPIIFSQWRVGQRGRLFRVFKFRSMVVDAEKLHSRVMGQQNGLHKLQNDPRVTPLGRWMRKLSLDELPQLVNVIRGEMSLVGPRPWALYDAVRIKPELRHRLHALPGITGAWQIEARSEQLDLDAVNQRDVEYVKSWSLKEDLRILLMTVPKVIAGSGAY